jgi:hypothetical protein
MLHERLEQKPVALEERSHVVPQRRSRPVTGLR